MGKKTQTQAQTERPIVGFRLRWRILWSIVIPMLMLCCYLAGYFLNNTMECMVSCAMQRAVLIQEAAQCNRIQQPPMSVAPNQSN